MEKSKTKKRLIVFVVILVAASIYFWQTNQATAPVVEETENSVDLNLDLE